jgi:Tol biopolymer transport system component
VFSQNTSEMYLGQTPPDSVAKLLIINDYFENEDNRKRSFNFAFSPDGNEMFFSYVKSRSKEEGSIYQIKTFKYENNEWKGPEIASFSSNMSDVDINYTPNGKYVFYASDRPQLNSVGNDIYYSVNLNNGWSESIYAGTDVNTIFNEVYPSVSAKGNLFFQSTRPGGHGSIDLYRAEWVNGNFINVRNLGSQINTEYYESDAVISPDESYILFCSQRKDDGNNRQIYISFQIGDNIWTKAKKLGLNVNNGFTGSPTFSADGKYLFFRKRNGPHWISTAFIEDLKPKKLNNK